MRSIQCILITVLLVCLCVPVFAYNFKTEEPFPRRTVLREDELFLQPYAAESYSKYYARPYVFSPNNDKDLHHPDFIGSPLMGDILQFDYAEPVLTPARMHKEDQVLVYSAACNENGDILIHASNPDSVDWELIHTLEGNLPDTMIEYRSRCIDVTAADVTGDGLDELVLSYPSGDYAPTTAMFTSDGNDGLAQIGYTLTDAPMSLHGVSHRSSSTAVAVGDIDDNNDMEVVMLYYTQGENTLNCQAVLFDLGEYDEDTGTIPYKVVSQLQMNSDYVQENDSVLDIEFGDFNGDQNYEAACAYRRCPLVILDADSDLQLGKHYDGFYKSMSNPYDIKIQTGDFNFDHSDNIAVMFEGRLRLYKMTDDLKSIETRKGIDILFVHDAFSSDFALGNYDGDDDPALEIFTVHQLKEQSMMGTDYPKFQMTLYDIGENLEPTAIRYYEHDLSIGNKSEPARYTLLAYDRDNDALILGDPQHYIKEAHHEFNLILTEPPKHIDYLTDIHDESTLTNVSNYSEEPPSQKSVLANFMHEQGKTTKVTHKSSTDFNFGVQVGGSISAGLKTPVVKQKATWSAKVSYAYNKKKSNWTEDSDSVTVSYDTEARNDDELIYRARRLHYYIYPIIGHAHAQTEEGEHGQGWLSIVIPEEQTKTLNLVPGRQAEWYQPVHENRNILSYPFDKGLVDNMGAPLFQNNDLVLTLGSNEVNRGIEWGGEHVSGDSCKTSHTGGFDFAFHYESKVKLGPVTGGAGKTFDFKTHFDKTWSNLKTSEVTTSDSQGINIHCAPISSEYAYQIQPLFYTNKATGAFQLSHLAKAGSATTSLASAQDFWDPNYGELPDPALNLPHRWAETEEEGHQAWELDTESKLFRKARGIWMLNEDGEPEGLNMVRGKRYTLRARIYNYSFKNTEQNVDVTFQYKDSDDGLNWSEGNTTLGTTFTPPIPGFGETAMTGDALAAWKYADLEFTAPSDSKRYLRIWAEIDPNDTIDEREEHDLYEEFDNNRGWFGQEFGVVDEDEKSQRSEVRGAEDITASLQIKETDQENTVDVHLTIHDVDAYLEHVHVLFFDTPPNSGSVRRAFDAEMIPHLAPGQAFVIDVPYTYTEEMPTIYAAIDYTHPDGGFQNIEIASDNLTAYDVTGWWYTPGEAGTGISMGINEDASALLLAWYVYDQSGSSIWYLAECVSTDTNTYTGELRRYTNSDPDSSTVEGEVTVDFTSAHSGFISWNMSTLRSNPGSKNIIRYVQDLDSGQADSAGINGWWIDAVNHPASAIFIEATGNTLYLGWYHYREDGTPIWEVMGGFMDPGGFDPESGVYTATVKETSGGQDISGEHHTPIIPDSGRPGTLTFTPGVGALTFTCGDYVYTLGPYTPGTP